jgi:hypothetical protein
LLSKYVKSSATFVPCMESIACSCLLVPQSRLLQVTATVRIDRKFYESVKRQREKTCEKLVSAFLRDNDSYFSMTINNHGS